MNEPQPERPFQRISPNPYIVGNPIRDRAMFFGREAEFELVHKRFEHQTRGGLIVFCGERRSGKTSILFQILDGRLGSEFLPVLIDMQSMAIAHEADFLERIADEIRSALGDAGARLPRPAFATSATPAAAFRRFVEEVLCAFPERKPILLFDEYELFENKIEAGTLHEEVLDTLTSLMEKHPVFLVFTGSQHLEQRRQPYWKILPKSIYRTISYLQPPDAVNLITQPVAGRVDYEPGVIEKILRLTAGQPFYTQAICQSLVDLLNDRQTRRATGALVECVVEGIVENPFPQMIFLWDGLTPDEKLVLSLLAEALPDAEATAGAVRVVERIREGKYPASISPPKVAAELEGLFRKELLEKDQALPAGYSFRMDLWRRWILRMHSVWQVVREERLEEAPRGRTGFGRLRVPRAALYALGVFALLAAVMLIVTWKSIFPPVPPGIAELPSEPSGIVRIETDPLGAVIELDGESAGFSSLEKRLPAGSRPLFRVTAAGFADSIFGVDVEADGVTYLKVRLRPRRNAVRVRTTPPGAEILVDGQPRGQSPLEVPGLSVPDAHRIEARLPDHDPVSRDFNVQVDSVLELRLDLRTQTGSLAVHTEPPGAEIRIDGQSRGISPFSRSDLPVGTHRVRAVLRGHVDAETTVVVGSQAVVIQLALKEHPPGLLILKGDRPARMFLDGASVAANVQNSGPRPVRPGAHEVQIVFVSGEVLQDTLEVASGERVVYDYSARAVTERSAQEAPAP